MEKDMFTDGYMKLQVRKVQTDYIISNQEMKYLALFSEVGEEVTRKNSKRSKILLHNSEIISIWQVTKDV